VLKRSEEHPSNPALACCMRLKNEAHVLLSFTVERLGHLRAEWLSRIRVQGSMTELQEGRLLEMFKENDSLLHHGGTISVVKILDGLGDGMAVDGLEVAGWWQRKQQPKSRRRRRKAIKEAAERAKSSMTELQEDQNEDATWRS